MAPLRATPKVAQPGSRQQAARAGMRHRAPMCVVLAGYKAAEPSSSWKPTSEEPFGGPMDWVKPEFDLDSFCLKKEIRKFSKAAAAGSMDLSAVDEVVEVEQRFSFAAAMFRKPDFATMRPFWHELL